MVKCFWRFRWHSQNLNERADDTCGPMWRHGRGWLHYDPSEDGGGPCIGVEWKVPTSHCYFYVERGGWDDEDIQFSLACCLFSLHVGFEHFVPRKWHKWWNPYKKKTLKVSSHNGSIYWCLWMDDDEWESKTPRWRRGSFNFPDFFLGRAVYSKKILSQTETHVPMPEESYPCTVSLEYCTWKRPRWPIVTTRQSAEIALHRAIPIPGKGENPWDGDDDALYSLTCSAKSVPDAIGRCVASVLRDRERYGGLDWQPSHANRGATDDTLSP